MIYVCHVEVSVRKIIRTNYLRCQLFPYATCTRLNNFLDTQMKLVHFEY